MSERAGLVGPPGRATTAWRRPAAILGAGSGAGVAIHVLAPAAGIVAAAAVPGFPAACAALLLARPRGAGARPPLSGRPDGGLPSRGGPDEGRPGGDPLDEGGADGMAARLVQVIAVAGIAACPMLALLVASVYPQPGSGYSWSGAGLTLVLAAEVTGGLWLVLRRPRPLAAGRWTALLGLAAALVIAGTFLLSQRGILPAGAVWTALLAAPAASAAAARLDGSPPSGIGACLWTGLLGGPALFVVSVSGLPRAIAAAGQAAPGNPAAVRPGAAGVAAGIAWDQLAGSIALVSVVFAITLALFACMAAVLYAVESDGGAADGRAASAPGRE